ncbi:MAG: hypothetical protein ACR2OV_15625 [Hyphomicrobiaceae bacterium]
MVNFWERILRHWFMLLVIFAGYCLAIAGILGADFGLPSLFRDDQALVEAGFLVRMVNGPMFLAPFSATILAGIITMFVAYLDQGRMRLDSAAPLVDHLAHFAPRIFALGVTALFCAVYLNPEMTGNRLDLNHLLLAVLGFGLGLVVCAALVVASWLLANRRGWQMFYTSLAVIVASLTLLSSQWLSPPAVAIFLLAAWVACFYAFMTRINSVARIAVAIAAFGWIIHSNGIKYKYTFDGIEDAKGNSYYSYEPKPRLTDREASAFTSKVRLLNPVSILTEWKQRLVESGITEKPKVVVVATSGGAYRAAFWTSIVLDSILKRDRPNDDFEGFGNSIRLITGASGGMVAGAYFTALKDNLDQNPDLMGSLENDIRTSQQEGNANELSKYIQRYVTRYPIERDSLSSVAQQLVKEDFLHIITPGTQQRDRGKVLESHWRQIDISFDELKEKEARGLRPSIILSPVMVETGQPLLISNLDLGQISKALPKTLAMSAQRGIVRQLRVPTASGQDRLKSQIEFFRLFPGSIEKFKLNTAVRMSASFAFITPAVELPTEPPLRIVDAGYYDIYGINTAVAYLRQQPIQDWLMNNTSGVVLVHVRAFPTFFKSGNGTTRNAKFRPMQQDPLCKKFGSPVASTASKIGRAFHFLTSPFEGNSAAQQTAMLLRGNQELDLLQDMYGGHLRMIVFENSSATSLNWNMSSVELDCLKKSFASAENTNSLRALRAFWSQ